jgi:tetratricopeptide (TPR) repeat protein
LASARTVNPEAHDAYLKGTYYWKTLRREDLNTAQRYFELAIEKDPNYAPAYAGLAWVWAARQQTGITPPHEAGPKAKAAALQAVELDDVSAGAHEALAVVMTWTDWDWASAELEFRRALELDPNAANTHAYFAHLLAITGRIDEAISHSERALELDPFNALFHGLYAIVLYTDRRYDDTLAVARTALATDPHIGGVANFALERAFFSSGMHDEQLAYKRGRIAGDPELEEAFEQGLTAAGHAEAHQRIADIMATRLEKSGEVVAPRGFGVYFVAQQYLYAGDYNRTIDWLEKALEARNPNMPYVGFQPLWDALRSDPRFQDLLRRMNLPLSTEEGGRN